MWAIRPPVACVVDAKPLQTLDACTNVDECREHGWFDTAWPNIHMGLHEGLNARERSLGEHHYANIGHALAWVPKKSSALLDYCIRRGHDVSCHDVQGLSVLQHALLQATIVGEVSPMNLLFFQILVDARAQFSNAKRVPKNNMVAVQIRKYIVDKNMIVWFAASDAIYEHVAAMYDK
jgi:hypothetical protein